MWKYIVRLILRYRWTNLIVLFLITVFMGYEAAHIKMSYEMAQMLPETDSTFIIYKNFKKKFGEDGSVMFVGVKDKRLKQLRYFNAWYDLTDAVKTIPGVKAALSVAKSFELVKNESKKKFDIRPMFTRKPQSQQELDSLIFRVNRNPFYKGLLFNDSGATILAITLDKDYIGSKSRFQLLNAIKAKVEAFSRQYEVKVHYSGLPYIRIAMSKIIKKEVVLFSLLTMLIASVMLLIFFKSVKAVVFPMIIVMVSVVWAVGLQVLLGYEITILTAILPPLITIIAVENNIFLLNKYYQEYRIHSNKIKGLARMIQMVGTPMLLTNLTTAIGFAAFIITQNHLLVQFGIITSISIFMVFVLSLVLVPVFFSLLPDPKFRHLKYLDRKSLGIIIDKVKFMSNERSTAVYLASLGLLLVGVLGLTLLKTTGNVVDDIPKDNVINTDLSFFEHEFKGVLPFEIQIDTRKKKGVMRMATLKRISKLQDTLASYPEFSKSLSVADLVKVAKQAFYNGNPEKYSLPSAQEKAFILRYMPKDFTGRSGSINGFVDSNLQTTRVTVQMKNIGSHDIDRIINDIKPKIDRIFNPEKYDVELTGTSIVFLKGTNYLVKNLMYSLGLAIVLIFLMMLVLFKSFRIASIAILPNLLPLLLTGALMGYLGISIKPSTIIIFSIALGISVDNTIHFLSRYRLALKASNWNIKYSVNFALSETTQSMIYSSIILFTGFSVFMFSSFGGTQSLGKLISFTLFVAMLSNLILLPSLLLSMARRLLNKQLREPFLEIFDEEEDVDIDSLQIEVTDEQQQNYVDNKAKE